MPSKRFLAGLVLVTIPASMTMALLAAEKAYVGNKSSKKFHLVTCAWAQKITPRNRIEFSSAEEAKKAGFIPHFLFESSVSHLMMAPTPVFMQF
jgi:hypothetical protein